MRILAIETSCDETAVCLIEASGTFGPDFRFRVLGNALHSQIEIHAQYGGVFPNLAKREHAKNLVPLLTDVLEASASPLATRGLTSEAVGGIEQLLEREPELFERMVQSDAIWNKPAVDAIAVTHGPGLEPALWVGVNFAKALSMIWGIPIVPVNHLEGHIAIALLRNSEQLSENSKQRNSALYSLFSVHFPAIALLISGGHTELDLVSSWPNFKMIGETRDDAVGEAFDKVARMMGLPYPGGPHISKLAEAARRAPREVHDAPLFKLPRPMLSEHNYDFSFSGLKTAVLRLVKDKELTDDEKSAMAREFEDAAADVLVSKTVRAVEEYGAQTVIIGGGVSANSHIKRRLQESLESIGVSLLSPPSEWATDNALMIALAGYFRSLNKEFVAAESLRANGNLRLGAVS